MFDPQHLEGASLDLVRSMFQVGRKAAELERVKLQAEIQKEKSELQRKKLEKWLKMASKAGGRSGLAKNPKKTKQEPDDDDLLDDLVTETGPDKGQPSYSKLEPGGFVTKAADRKTRLDQRQARMAAAAGEPGDGNKEETEQERLEREANELDQPVEEGRKSRGSSTGKGTMGQSQMIQPMDNRWTLFEATESRDTSGGQKEKKVDEDGGHCEHGRRR